MPVALIVSTSGAATTRTVLTFSGTAVALRPSPLLGRGFASPLAPMTAGVGAPPAGLASCWVASSFGTMTAPATAMLPASHNAVFKADFIDRRQWLSNAAWYSASLALMAFSSASVGVAGLAAGGGAP